ncbi:hypothetical protein [Clostridium thermobutyricum]|uniref:Uncharacterized protein n=1 Tax=Clostridium thermobutyricum DSM 4928 TaxID=1121339 RepID=A0A1V4SQR5_9CLOT|nr:hypothetical protein [Clostridium thermobutyricum]OPX45587.1 hypothetical protein CLTHE_30150 [Clostridium thermobutyricum DSM 4928]
MLIIDNPCCETCKFNFGSVCASHGYRLDNNEDTYGMTIDETKEMFPNGCSEYFPSLDYFSKLCEQGKVPPFEELMEDLFRKK